MTRSLPCVLFLCLMAPPAWGQAYVAPPCPADAPPAFVDDLQPLWYRRFWTGECQHLPRRCRPGRPYWNDVVRTLTDRAPAAQRSAIAARACALGRRIGFEWTRPSAKRRIDTRELQALHAMLEKAPDVTTGLNAVEARVRTKTDP
ncbi:MAG: hypothetical protein Q8Q88_14645 [Phenylobacterium sp.]|uniref:hypothetical protein n=1 Tax=Phenylobacterium sp. TaxID=1871053 RepID=UPI002736F9A7|nr:hypothetical protein [Phenylobacterium sp.]MDP3748276.1 hypothetical protein [Phenylobacterium sp.]